MFSITYMQSRGILATNACVLPVSRETLAEMGVGSKTFNSLIRGGLIVRAGDNTYVPTPWGVAVADNINKIVEAGVKFYDAGAATFYGQKYYAESENA